MGSMTGSAMMKREIAQFFFDIGVPLYDCYGLSETSPAITVNSSVDYKLGTVGKPLERVRVVIDTSLGDPDLGDGEIIAYGPNVMKGYQNKPEQTKEVITMGVDTIVISYYAKIGYMDKGSTRNKVG